jgi:hypothetical protein
VVSPNHGFCGVFHFHAECKHRETLSSLNFEFTFGGGMSTPGSNPGPWVRSWSTSRQLPIWFNTSTKSWIEDTGQPQPDPPLTRTTIDVGAMERTSRAILSPVQSRVSTNSRLKQALDKGEHSALLERPPATPPTEFANLCQVLSLKCC